MAEDNEKHKDPVIEVRGRLSPERLIEEVGEERIDERLRFLEGVYNRFSNRWDGVRLNPYLLRETVESYFCDIYRLKFFRPIDYTNAHKQAAYTMKWLSRIRPIQMISGAGPLPTTIMSNAYYALMAGFALLDISFDNESSDWWASYVTEAVYNLHFHSPSVESLGQAMCALQALTKLEAVSTKTRT